MPISFSSPFKSLDKRRTSSRANVGHSSPPEVIDPIMAIAKLMLEEEEEESTYPPIRLEGVAARAAQVGWHGTKELLYLLRDSTDVFPPLKSCVGGFVALVEICERTRGVSKGMVEVTERLERLMGILAKRLAADGGASSLPNQISDHTLTLAEALKQVKAMNSQGTVRLVVQSRSLQEQLESICRTIVNVIQEIQLAIGLAVERNTSSILQEVVFQSLGRARSAAYTAVTTPYGILRRSCTPDTRVMVIDQIVKWATRIRYVRSNPIFWLAGLAGQGKTTIAYTICEHLEQKRKDIAVVSLFCSRRLDSHEERLLVSTLALELAESSASYASELYRALQQDHDLGDQVLSVQMSKLLLGPWERSAHARAELRPTILVIDAIDENDAGLEFVYLILSAINEGRLSGLRVFFTSRPDLSFKEAFEGLGEKMVSIHRLNSSLSSMWNDNQDILLYLQAELHGDLDDATIKDVAEASYGLFLYASTIVRLVKSKGRRRTRREQETRVRRLLEHIPAFDQRDVRIAEVDVTILDGLYDGVVQDMLNDLDDEEMSARLFVLLTVACTSQVLDVPLLAALAGVEEELVNVVVEALNAVLYLDEDRHVFWCHKTFQDYVLGTYKEFIPLTRQRVVQGCHDFLQTSTVTSTAESGVASGSTAASQITSFPSKAQVDSELFNTRVQLMDNERIIRATLLQMEDTPSNPSDN